jgi:hypothetical protein
VIHFVCHVCSLSTLLLCIFVRCVCIELHDCMLPPRRRLKYFLL